MADSACAGVDEDGLAGVDLSSIHETFPGGDGAERQSCGLAHRQVSGFEREEICIDCDVFGEGALMAADSADEAVDFITFMECGNAGGGLYDSSSHVQT